MSEFDNRIRAAARFTNASKWKNISIRIGCTNRAVESRQRSTRRGRNIGV